MIDLTRRTFTAGLSAIAGSSARGGPAGLAIAAAPSADDAYEALLSSYIAAEEKAASAGRVVTGSGSGALSVEGRRVERYLAELDLRVDPLTTARDVISDFRSFVARDREPTLARPNRPHIGPQQVIEEVGVSSEPAQEMTSTADAPESCEPNQRDLPAPNGHPVD
jgi:hypothetical protein